MEIKSRFRKLEKPFIITGLSFWLGIYLLSRIFLEMYTDHSPSAFWLWAALALLPFTIYFALRTTFSKNEVWYSFIGYFLIYTLGGVVVSEYLVVNGDILISAVSRPSTGKEVTVLEVHKVFQRKLGFDHTAVTVQVDGKPVILEARPYAYFYLKDKTKLHLSLGKSKLLGNVYVTSVAVPLAEKTHARWLHLKDWVYRFRILWGFVVCAILGIWIRIRYFPEKPGAKPLKLGFWKLLGIVMAVVFALGLLAYAGLWIYVSFFSGRHL